MICTIYSTDGTPISRVSSKRALVLDIILDRINVISYHDNKVIRTVDTEYPLPKEAVVKQYISLPEGFYEAVPLNPRTLKLRDRSTCQYCGRGGGELKRSEFWTIDHVHPKSKGGKHRWDNVVLSCNTCNNRKDDMTPEEADMRPITEPRRPTRWELV